MNTNSQIHPTAIVHPNAKLGNNVHVGAYSVIGEFVELKDNVFVYNHACIEGDTVIGEGSKIYPFAVIGFAPPDLKYKGERSRLRIGKNCIMREHSNIHTGTAVDRNETTIGDNCLFMTNTHVAHDCVVGNNVIMANNSALGGHVIIEDFVIIGGLVGIHQFCRIGAYSIIGSSSRVVSDVIPFGTFTNEEGHLAGLNIIGMKRRNMDSQEIKDLNKAYKQLFHNDEMTLDERISKTTQDFPNNENVMRVIDFIKKERKMPLCRSK